MGLIERCWLVTYLFPASLVSDLYIVLFDKIRTDPEGTPHGREGYYFGASGEHLMYDVCKAVAEVLVERGKGKSPEPTTFSQGDLDKYFNGVCPSLPSIQAPEHGVTHSISSVLVTLSRYELPLCGKQVVLYRMETKEDYCRFPCLHPSGSRGTLGSRCGKRLRTKS